MKKKFNKKLVKTKGDDENFGSSTKCWTCDNTFAESDIKVMDHCHITRQFRGATRKDCNNN